MNYEETQQARVEIDQIVEAIRDYKFDKNSDGIVFNMDRKAAVAEIMAYIRKNYTRKKPDAFVSVSATA